MRRRSWLGEAPVASIRASHAPSGTAARKTGARRNRASDASYVVTAEAPFIMNSIFDNHLDLISYVSAGLAVGIVSSLMLLMKPDGRRLSSAFAHADRARAAGIVRPTSVDSGQAAHCAARIDPL
jgi:hypothetical protein